MGNQILIIAKERLLAHRGELPADQMHRCGSGYRVVRSLVLAASSTINAGAVGVVVVPQLDHANDRCGSGVTSPALGGGAVAPPPITC